jgi:hypothetical protein
VNSPHYYYFVSILVLTDYPFWAGLSLVYKIDGLVIVIQGGSFLESRAFAGVDWDAWVNNAYARKQQSYGWVGGWQFTCMENADAVTWANSVANHLYTHIADGAAVTLEITNGTKHSLPVGQTVHG